MRSEVQTGFTVYRTSGQKHQSDGRKILSSLFVLLNAPVHLRYFSGTITVAVIELDVRACRDNDTESWCHGEGNSSFCASQNKPRTLNDERNPQAEYRWKYLEFYSGT